MKAALASAPPVAQAPVNRARQTVTPFDDALEREADHVADKVMSGRVPKPDLKPANVKRGSVPPSVRQTLASPGEPLGQMERGYFEPRFGKDLSTVSIHRGAAAEHSTTALGARAYTYGNHIVFGAGQFAPGTPSGNRLIAHELAHTLQQQGGMPAIQRKPRLDAATESGNKPAIISVTAYQGAQTGEVVMSDQTSATVEITVNKLAPGDYVTTPVGLVRKATAQGVPDKFVYRYPVDPYTGELLDGVASRIEIHILAAPAEEVRQLPAEIRDFVTSDRARPGSADEYQDAAFAGKILEQAGVTADELALVQESRRHEHQLGTAASEFGTQSDWALDYVEKRKNKKLGEASNREALVEMAKIMADAPIHLLHHGGVGNILESDNNKLDLRNYLNLLKFNKIVPRSKQELTSTGARLLSEFQALIRHFEDALVADLTNIAVAALDSAEASILRMDKKYVGMWQDKKWSPHYFWNEVERIKGNEKVIAAAAERDKVKSTLESEQREDAIGRALNPIGSVLEPVLGSSSYSQRTDQREKESERQDQIFNQAVAEQSSLKVTPGFSAEHILAAKDPDDAVGRLTDFLFDGRRKITRARGRIAERKIIFAADKIIDTEKERLKGPLGSKASDISRVIDDLASYRKSQTSIWEDILKVVEFVSMFVPGPIGWGLRVGVAAVNFDKKMTDIGTRSDLYGANLSAKSVGSGEVGDALFNAALEVVPDFPIGQRGKSLTLGLERAATSGTDDVARITTQVGSTTEHGVPSGLADDVAGRGGKVQEPPAGSGTHAEGGKPDLGVPTYGNLPGRVPKGGERVRIIEKDGKYFELDYETNALTPASGEYAFARMPDGSLWASRYGHAEASMGGRVAYAGQMDLDGGVLKSWGRESGTYKPVGGEFSGQAGFPIPPRPLPPQAGTRVQLPVFQEPPGSVITPVSPDKFPPKPPPAAGSGAPAELVGDAASAAKVPQHQWTDYLPEAQQRTQAAKAKYGDSLIMMATPGSPDSRIIRQLAAQGTLSRAEMQVFIEALLREHPVLGQLASAQRLTGAAQRKEMLSILDRVYRENRLAHEVVPNEAVAKLTQPGNMASLRSAPGILQIEQRAYDSTELLAAEVTHELCYYFSRSGGNVPTLEDLFNGLDVLELTIRNGGRYPFPP